MEQIILMLLVVFAVTSVVRMLIDLFAVNANMKAVVIAQANHTLGRESYEFYRRREDDALRKINRVCAPLMQEAQTNSRHIKLLMTLLRDASQEKIGPAEVLQIIQDTGLLPEDAVIGEEEPI